MESRWPGYQQLTGRQAARYSGLSLLTAVGIVFSSLGPLFQPFWAYGWAGVDPDTIIFVVATILLVIVAMCISSAIMIVLSYGVGRLWKSDYIAWGTFSVMMLISFIAGIPVCLNVMRRLTSIDWP